MKSKTKNRLCIWGFCLIISGLAFAANYYGSLGGWVLAVIVSICLLLVSGVELNEVVKRIDKIGPGGIDFEDSGKDDDG